MARKKRISKIPEDETSQDRFRRVIAQRLKPVTKGLGMIEKMPTQPNYDINSHDAQMVIDEITRVSESVISIFEKVRDGDLKAKEIKEYQGIDWDKELESTEEDK